MDFLVKVPIYNSRICFCITDSEEERAKVYMKWFNTKECEKEKVDMTNSDGRTIESTTGPCLIFLKPTLTISTVTHEIQHAVYRILEWVGVKYSRESEEAFTYLSSFIVDEFYKKYAILKRKFENKAKIKPQEQRSNES